MINNKKILAIIPARGGSKGVPRKNIKLLRGRPLIGYTIEAAVKSKYIDNIIVSTEDKEIAEVAQKYGANVPFLRPIKLAQDNSSSTDVIMQCIGWLRINDIMNYDYICLLQCTSPFRVSRHIDEALEIMINKDADSIVSLCETDESPYWMKQVIDNKIEKFINSNEEYIRRQDLPKTYRTNGAIYIIKIEEFLKIKNWYTHNTVPYIMSKVESIDIDTMEDFEWAEFMMDKLYRKEAKYEK